MPNNGSPVFSPLFLAILQFFQVREFIGGTQPTKLPKVIWARQFWRHNTCKVAEREFLQRLLPFKQPKMILSVVGILNITGKIYLLAGIFGEQNA